MSANSPFNTKWPDDEQPDSSKNYSLSGRIMLASVITLFVIVFFLVLLHLNARWYLLRLHRRNDTRRHNPRNRSTRIVYYVENNRSALASGSSGLDASVLKLLPLFVYSSETEMNMPECAVCLSEFEDGETGRILPNCKHSFHIGCIDMWFGSHSTCPLCRSPVEPVQKELTEFVPEPGSSVPLSSPVQHCTEVSEAASSSADRRKQVDIRIDVPSVAENEFQVPSPSEGLRSPGSRLLSFKRIINMNRRSPVVSPSSGATESEVESARQESDLESSRPGTVG